MDKEKQKQAITEIMNDDAKDGLYKQMTAVQLLIQSLQDAFPDEMYGMMESDPKLFKEKVIKSDNKFREQIEEGYNQGYRDGENDGWMNGDKDISNYSNANQYYTQTYGE